jgi:hypothetical protein
LFIWFVWFIWLVSFNQTDETDQIDETDKITKQTGLMRGAGWFRAEPGCVLEDALRTGVVDELLAADETLLHLYSAPGAESIGEIS